MVDVLLAVLAIGGAGLSALASFPVRSSYAASDLKTVYASAWCFTHGLNAYTVSNIGAVFHAQGVETPSSWFGHAAVYPPTSLALIAPLTLLSMTAAVYCVTILSTVALMVAVWSLLRYASENFGLGIGWKMVLVCLCAAGPLLSFAFEQGNFAVMASALAIIAFTRRNEGQVWMNASALAVAFLLKPPLAIWILVGMFLLPLGKGRRIAIRAAMLSTVFSMAVIAGMAWRGCLGFQWSGLISTLHQETLVGASMNASSRVPMPIAAQITSMQSLVGFWTGSTAVVACVTTILLVLLAYVLVKETLQVRTEREASIAVCGWLAFGMLATYHRAYDAVSLLLFLPYALDRLRQNYKAWQVWAMAGLYAIMSIGPATSVIASNVGRLSIDPAVAFVLLRQAGLADLCFFAFVVMTLRSERSEAVAAVRVKWKNPRYQTSHGGRRPIGQPAGAKYGAVTLGEAARERKAGTY